MGDPKRTRLPSIHFQVLVAGVAGRVSNLGDPEIFTELGISISFGGAFAVSFLGV